MSSAFAQTDNFNISVSIYSGSIITPANGKICSPTPTITGQTFPEVNVEIKGKRGGSDVVVATTTADKNGMFAIQVASNSALDVGANTLTLYANGLVGKSNQITVKQNPLPAEEPVIETPLNGAQFNCTRPRVKGKAKPGDKIELYRKFSDGLLEKFGQGTVRSTGNFDLGAWDYFLAGEHYIYVVVNGVASYMIKLECTDPAGRVYDSQTGESIEGARVTLQRSLDAGVTWSNAVQGIDIQESNPQITGSDGKYAFLAINGLYKLTVSKNGYVFPSTIIPVGQPHTGSHGEQFNVISEPLIIDLPVDFRNELLLRVDKAVNKKEVHIGDIVTYTVTIKNISAEAVTGIYLKDELAPGLKYLAGKVLLDGQPIADPAGSRVKKFAVGTINADASRVLRYQVIVGSGVTFGEYKNKAWGEFSSTRQISNVAQETVKVIPEPIFDLGIVVGKVFWDKNENGSQDRGEIGISNSNVVTEEGAIITTDKDGKFHLAGIIPGRHLFRLDERTLPKEAYLTTEKIVIVDVTPGLFSKVNFGVQKKDGFQTAELGVRVKQETKVACPRLNAALFNQELIFENNVLLRPVEFRIFTNYHYFIDKWQLEILDRDTKSLVKKFVGNKDNINQPVPWDGKTEENKELNQNKAYVYLLKVFAKDGKEDSTKLMDLKIKWLDSGKLNLDEKENQLLGYQEWLEKENKTNNLEKQGINKIGAKVVSISYDQQDFKRLRVIGSNDIQLDIPLISSRSVDVLGPESSLEKKSSFSESTEILLLNGEYDVEIYKSLDVGCRMSDVKGEKDGVSIREVGSMAKGDGISRENLQNNEKFSKGGTIWPDISTTESGSLNTLKHSRGQGEISQQDIHPVSLPGQGLSIRGNDLTQDSGAAAVSEAKRNGGIIESVQRDSSKDQQFNQLDKNNLASGIGHWASDKIYSQHIKVGEEQLFFVALGDAKMGWTVNKGNIEPVQQDEKFKQGFWQEGKMAYYLKGKIKGKYLITSSLDTERGKYQKTLFKNLDPNEYYPVYGDASTVNYDATNTQGLLYLLLEWDKSSALWGNFNTDFAATEFATYNRSLYGGKFYSEDVSLTQFSEPRTKLIVFRANIPDEQKPSHNEFLSTGSSLYYLKYKDVIEGSDKINIEVRDKVTGLVVASKQMQEGIDYDIDYSQGRIIFWKPITQIAQSDLIISPQLMAGNPVYVIADYEYKTTGQYEQHSSGVRIERSLTDYFRLGTTYVEEDELDKHYRLKGVDNLIHFGKDIKLTGEYAESSSNNISSYLSVDGGLTFAEVSNTDFDGGKAYGLKLEAYLLNKLGLNSYYKRLERGFSSATTTSGQGKELIGASLTSDLTKKMRVKVSHDLQKLIDEGNSQTQLQVGAKETSTSSAQVTYNASEKLKLTSEYQHQNVQNEISQFNSQANLQGDTAAAKAEYQPNQKLTLSLAHQVQLNNEKAYQTTMAADRKINQSLSLRFKEITGSRGDATGVGLTSNLNDYLKLTGDYTLANYKSNGSGDILSLGSEAKVDDKTKLYTTYAADTSGGQKNQSIVLGSKRKINDNLDFTTEKTYASNSQDRKNSNSFGLSGIKDKWSGFINFDRGVVQSYDGAVAKRSGETLGLNYVDKEDLSGDIKFRASTKLEYHLDKGQEKISQYLLYNTFEGKINPDATLFLKANFSQSKNDTANTTTAEFKELVTGVAYRPINFDRLNLLGKHTYLENFGSSQGNGRDVDKEKAHVLAVESIYDLTQKWQVSEKIACKIGKEKVAGFDYSQTQTLLEILRFCYKINKNWQIASEYRWLGQKQAKDYKQGFLAELCRNIGEFLQISAGYNFTDFNDDLTRLNYRAGGPFIRFTGKFSEGILNQRKRQDVK